MTTRYLQLVLTCCLLHLAAVAESGDGWIELTNPQYLPKLQDSSVSLQLSMNMVLLDVRYPSNTTIWVSSNGYISFGSKFNEKLYQKVSLPINASKDGDPLIIAPFRARTKYRPDELSDKLASVSYTLNLEDDSLAELNSIIRSTVAGKHQYISKQAFAVSWNQISFYGGDPASAVYHRNTFQVVITTDGESTFAIFNYKNIVWDGGFSSGGDSKTGIGANNPPAQAGINVGAGNGFIKLDYGSNILDIDQEQASETTGQYVYELSLPTPLAHGCSPKSLGTRALRIFPSSGPMFGGIPIEVTNVCLKPEQSIKCQFGDQTSCLWKADESSACVVVTGTYLSPSRALCYTPTFYANQRYRFKFIIDGKEVKSGETFYFASINSPNRVKLIDIDSWRSLSPKNKRLEIKWNSLDLAHYKGKLDLKLFIYSENLTFYGWREELIIAKGIPNTGSYSFSTADIHCDTDCVEKTVGAIALELVKSLDIQHPGRLWSNVGPLGWYADSYLRHKIGNKWPDQMCYNWFVEDTNEGFDWLKELEDCPCTKEQAVSDIGRFIPDPGCNMYKKSGYSCYYHQGADHCVRSIWPSKPTGAGTQCCYSSEGNLMYAGDSIYGSTVDKGHNQGAAPYNAPGLVPSLSHWIHDVVTYQYCCLWNVFNSTCGIYMDQRPTKDCNAYESVEAASLYGDTNIHTFSEKNFTYDKPGIYSLLESSNKTEKTGGWVQIQAKLTAVPAASLTALTGIFLSGDNSSRIEITLNAADRLQRTTVRVDGVERSFTDPAWFKQQYQGVQILSWDITPVTDHSNFTISLDSGLGLRITAHQYNLNVVVTAPQSFVAQLNPISLLGASGNGNPQNAALKSSPLLTIGDGDLSLNGSKIAASLETQNAEAYQWFKTLRLFTKTVVSCGMPVMHGIRDGTNYLEGSRVRIISCRHGYNLVQPSAEQTYTCNSSGTWEPEIKTLCQYSGFPEFTKSNIPTKQNATVAKDKLAIPIALSMTGAVILVIVIAVIVYKLRKRRLKSKNRRGSIEENEMASTGSMPLNSAIPNSDLRTQGMLGVDVVDPKGGNSYRIAVDPLLKKDHQNQSPSQSAGSVAADADAPGKQKSARTGSMDLDLNEIK